MIASQVRERADLSSAKLILRLKDDQKKLKLSEMDSVLQVSYELLTLELQKCLCELSVFANSFDSAAAAAVWAIDKDKADDLLAACRSEVLGKRDEVVN